MMVLGRNTASLSAMAVRDGRRESEKDRVGCR